MPKFDVVVGNPPFNKLPKEGKKLKTQGKKLWIDFVKISFNVLKEEGYFCSVLPIGFYSPINKVHKLIFNHKILYLNMDCREYFLDIADSMGYIIIKNIKRNSDNIPICGRDKDVFDINFITGKTFIPPLKFNRISYSIVNKVLNNDFPNLDLKSNKVTSVSKIPNEEFKYRIDNGLWEDVYTNKKPNHYGYHKALLWSRVKRYKHMRVFVCKPDLDTFTSVKTSSFQGRYILTNSIEESKNVSWYVGESKLMHFVISLFTTNQYCPRILAENIKQIDFKYQLNDNILFNIFGLTEEEIKYVEANV